MVRQDAQAEPAVAQVLPDLLDRVELRRVRRQVDQREVDWDPQVGADVLPRPVEDEHGVGPGRHGPGQLGQEQAHGRGRDLGQHQRDARVPLRADRTEQLDGGEALLPRPARPSASLVPDVRDAALLADPGLVLEPQLDPLARVLARDRLD